MNTQKLREIAKIESEIDLLALALSNAKEERTIIYYTKQFINRFDVLSTLLTDKTIKQLSETSQRLPIKILILMVEHKITTSLLTDFEDVISDCKGVKARDIIRHLCQK